MSKKYHIAVMSFISIEQLTANDVQFIFDQAKRCELIAADPNKSKLLSGKILANIFYEPSSRTSSSFYAAMLNLGGNVIPIASDTSSIAKGETLEDTIRTMSTYCDVIVLRHPQVGAAKRAALCSPVPVLNAGDGIGEHPSQALLDLFTIQKEIGDVCSATIAMVGDLTNGRTVHSLTKLLNLVGVGFIHFISPESLQMPKDLLETLRVPYKTSTDLNCVLPDIDVLYVTRVQKERFQSISEYDRVKDSFIITPKTLTSAKQNMIVMHPLPRTSEISAQVDQDPRAAYFRQMKNGLYIRMALLARSLNYLLRKRISNMINLFKTASSMSSNILPSILDIIDIQLRHCQKSLSSLCNLIRCQDRTLDTRAFTQETIATTCQALSQYRDEVPNDVISVVNRWIINCSAPISSTAASKFLQSSNLLPRLFINAFHDNSVENEDFRQTLASIFINDIESCSAGAVVGGAISMTRIPFQRKDWEKIVHRANKLDLSLSQVAKLSGAFARAGLHIKHPNLVNNAFGPVIERVQKIQACKLKQSFAVERCTELIWSLSRVAMLPKKWTESVLVEWLLEHIPNMESQRFTQIVSALSHAAICPSQLYTIIENRLNSSDLSHFSSQSLANLCWSLAVARRPKSLPLLWKQLSFLSELPATELSQIYQSFLWAHLHGHNLRQAQSFAELKEISKRAFFSALPTTDANSDLLQNVKLAAKSIWPDIQTEIQCPNTGYWLDLVRPSNNQVFEVNGPQHYCRLSSRLRGSSLLKSSILRKSGWSLRTIPYFEWTFGRANTESQTHYLSLKAMGID